MNALEAPCERIFHLRRVMTILIDDSSLRYGPSANLEVHRTAQQLGGHGSPRFGVGWARTTVRTITASIIFLAGALLR